MQGWLFQDDFWGDAEIQALLSGVPNDGQQFSDLRISQCDLTELAPQA